MSDRGVSVLILTLNEEINIGPCLDTLNWCDDVIVLDSYSTDRTMSIATASGARVVQREFDSYAGQRNFGLREIEYKHQWVFMLDADERVPADLRDELLRVTAQAPEEVALYLVRRKDHLFGRWLKHSSGYPTWFGRLARVGKVWVERPINEEFCTSGQVDRLLSHIHHYPFNKGFSAWLAKHNRYSTMEAELLFKAQASLPPVRELFITNPPRRRKALKRLMYAMPGRPFLMFMALYVLKLGFADGRAGLTFSLLRSWYEFMIDCKHRELRRREQQLPL